MDKLVETAGERFWNPEAWERDQWMRNEAKKLAAGSRVLDAGAGASKYRSFFSHCRYETQDFCEYKGELVRYIQPIDHVCDITQIPLEDQSFDAIFCTEVIEHVPNPIAVIAEFGRLLRPGGKLFLTAPHGTTLHMEPFHYYGGFTHYWYRYWLPRYGFEIEEILPQGGPGRSAVAYLHAFYNSWRDWEHKLSRIPRLCSFVTRISIKLPIHYGIPWILPKFDRHLNRFQICIGLMVAATRMDNQALDQGK